MHEQGRTVEAMKPAHFLKERTPTDANKRDEGNCWFPGRKLPVELSVEQASKQLAEQPV